VLPNLTIIIAVYCVLRLLWHIENARVGIAGKPHLLLTILSIIGICVIAYYCLSTIGISVEPASFTPYSPAYPRR